MLKVTIGIIIVVVSSISVSCAPQYPSSIPASVSYPSPLSAELVTLSIEDISCPSSRTLVKVLVEVDQSFWGELDSSPPPGAMLIDTELSDDKGYSYPIDAVWGDPYYSDPSTGTIQIPITAAFDGIACNAKELTFSSSVELRGIPSNDSFIVDFRNRGLGDAWIPTGVIHLAGMTIPVNEVRITLISVIEDGSPIEEPSLEFRATPVEERGLRLNCLEFQWVSPGFYSRKMSWGCESNISSITFSIMGGPLYRYLEDQSSLGNDIEFKVFGSVQLIDRRELTWSFK